MDFQLTAEQQALKDGARTLARQRFAPRALGWERFPWENAKVLAEVGFTGITIAAEDGGQGGTLFDAVLVREAISEVCPHSGDAVQATNFGAIRQLAAFGTDRVKRELLPPLLAADALIGPGMSESDAGSALTELRTTAAYRDGDVELNGQKLWSSHGPDLTHSVVWCRFGPRTRDIGCVVVPVDAPGFCKGPAERYMSGERYCALYFDQCRVPRDYVLLDGGALARMLTTFGVERIGNAVRALALGQAAFDHAVGHAKNRQQFGRPLCDFQGLQWKFADMRMRLDAARLLVYRAALNTTENGPDPTEASIAKCFANEAAFEVANQALQVHGAAGCTAGSPMEYYLRRIRGWMIAGGSTEMLRNRIAEGVFGRRFSQGHP